MSHLTGPMQRSGWTTQVSETQRHGDTRVANALARPPHAAIPCEVMIGFLRNEGAE
jgi:hypothetical protein